MRGLLLLLCACLLTACAVPDARRTAQRMQEQSDFEARRFPTPGFVLFGLLRPARNVSSQASAQGSTLHVYIEGDGYAWVSRRRPSADPTPREAVALRLAEADPGPGPVLYLARPCQYVSGEDARMCSEKYWTSARLAPEVINSLNAAVEAAKKETGARQVALIGYSGGGGAAALLAAKREDVAFLGTVAGTLDHAAWTARHNVSPLRNSLNPLEAAPQVRHIPQRHVSGRDDAIMPPEISANFCRAVQRPEACVTVSGVAHDGAWERVWTYDY